MATFLDLGLSESLNAALTEQGITTPMSIQALAYPVLSAGADAWLSSSTGSGKTLAYLLPLLKDVDTTGTDLQIAILAPTQELAVQIHDSLCLLYKNQSDGLRSQLLIGNASIKRQKEKLKKKPHIVIGSCGRMLELGKERKLKLHKCKCIVIDEADRMLEDESIQMLERFIKMVPRDRQLVFASATDKGNAFEIAGQIGTDVKWLKAEEQQAKPKIEHYYLEEAYIHKADALRRLLHALKPEKAIVFFHRNETAELVQEKLSRKDLNLVMIHGALSKFERQKALGDFRKGKANILISSDVSSRGLDIKGVTHIINLDVPSKSDDYIHRVGRTARMGAQGIAVSIIAANEKRLINRYEKELGIEIMSATVREGEFRV